VKETFQPAVVPADPEANATALLLDRVAKTPGKPLFAVPEGAGWRDITAAEFHEQVVALAKGFIAEGVQPGDKVAFMCRTRYEWTLVDFALWFAGAVMVPVYETSSASQLAWNIEDSGAVMFLAETAEHFARFEEVRERLTAVRRSWRMDEGALDRLRAAGAAVSDEQVEQRRSAAKGSDIATLIYTSGSSGRPRGCVLTHSNFVELARNSAKALEDVLDPEASTLLFITLAHVFARFISVLSVHAGVRVGHQADTTRLMEAMGTFRPSFLLAVPRVFEKVYNVAEQKAAAGGKGKIFAAAVETAIAHSRAVMSGGRVPLGLALRFRLYDALVYRRLKAALGGRARYAVSGSAPLGERLGHFFHSLGLTILEGYGLTETTAPATVNRPEKFVIGTVGPVLPGVALRIAEDGEIEVKGIDVFAGYWNDPEGTREAFTEDGFFKTGDLGSLDEDGYLTITGRKKEIIITAGGKNVAPAPLEDRIRANPVVGQVVVCGDGKPFISALITLDPEMLPTWLSNNGQSPQLTLAQAAENPAVIAEVQRAVDAANASVSRAESIRKFRILPTEWTQDSGHLTPKLSIKRHVIMTDFAPEVEAMYAS